MLFLFNTVLFDLGDPETAALSCGAPLGEDRLKALSLAKTVKLLREAVFDCPELGKERRDKARFLAAMIAWKTREANALLAVRPTAARTAMEVDVRLASVSLVALTQLGELQRAGRLTGPAINDAVWNHAPQRMPA